MADPGSTVVATATLVCPDPATAQQYAANIYAAFAGIYPAQVTGNDPHTAFANQLMKYIHDTLLQWQTQATLLAQQAAIAAALSQAQAGVTESVVVTFV